MSPWKLNILIFCCEKSYSLHFEMCRHRKFQCNSQDFNRYSMCVYIFDFLAIQLMLGCENNPRTFLYGKMIPIVISNNEIYNENRQKMYSLMQNVRNRRVSHQSKDVRWNVSWVVKLAYLKEKGIQWTGNGSNFPFSKLCFCFRQKFSHSACGGKLKIGNSPGNSFQCNHFKWIVCILQFYLSHFPLRSVQLHNKSNDFQWSELYQTRNSREVYGEIRGFEAKCLCFETWCWSMSNMVLSIECGVGRKMIWEWREKQDKERLSWTRKLYKQWTSDDQIHFACTTFKHSSSPYSYSPESLNISIWKR